MMMHVYYIYYVGAVKYNEDLMDGILKTRELNCICQLLNI